MKQNIVEILLFSSVAINAALLVFIAGVLRKIMNDMDEVTFKNFVSSLVRYSSKSPFMIITLNIPFLGIIPYIYFYGSTNWWILSGVILWFCTGIISKLIKVPIYKKLDVLKITDATQIKEMRRRMNNGNIFQAILTTVAVLIMVISFI